ncbi:MAG: bifunctional folylpolyglutamate synthase/dihydrofolate synthase [Flavobacteriales bacterium]|nr:bifunctional folylpolyglutamate synthase/dihydrofolate synthase [Flavobacteriales bacterium]
MTYAETVAYLFARLPMFQRVGKAAYKADLSNTHALMELLDHPERGLKCIHVAGTNGKGSTCHFIASILQEAGYSVGLHTSPHLKDLRERFRLNGELVDQQAVIDFVERNRETFEPVQPSFFEWGVAFALDLFRERQVDIAVLETGMGGRLDSTNVVVPEVSVITSIGLDHMEFLGRDLPSIAREKAGIIKPGVPLVLGPVADEARDVIFDVACQKGSVVHEVQDPGVPPHPVGLAGEHQRINAALACATVDVLNDRGWSLRKEDVRNGCRNVVGNTGIRGRWEVLSEKPRVIADVAHNVDGMRMLLTNLCSIPHQELHIVLGMVNDKDIGAMLELLPAAAHYYFCKADIPRGLDVGTLYGLATDRGLNGKVHASVKDARDAAVAAADGADLVLITGSVFVVAEAL